MGYAMAEAAAQLGHDVTLISGPVNLSAPSNVRIESINTSDEMFEAVQQATRSCDVLVMCAAVADYKPKTYLKQKFKKRSAKWALNLIPTRDILASLATGDRSFLVVGFAAETQNIAINARKKLREKNCDMIVANDVSSSNFGMESAENEVTIFFSSGESETISRARKKIIAKKLMKIISNACEKRLTKKS